MVKERAFAAACAAVLLPASPAWSEGAAAPSADHPGDATTRAKPHFDNGIKLYRDGNFSGALAEFEAAYRIKPGASSLRNVALSLKALFRYSEARTALETLLGRHGAELDEPSLSALEAAVRELESLIGSVVLEVVPPEARVTVDGRSVPNDSAKVALDVGEHVIAAEADGYAPEQRTIRVAGGGALVTVRMELRAVSGLVTVVTADPSAAIAVDGQARAYGRWRGRVPGGRHFVQVYREGFTQFEQAFTIAAGESTTIEAPALVQDSRPREATTPAPAAPPEQRGWYGLLALTPHGEPPGTPDNLDHDGNSGGGGVWLGVRAGYRLWTPVAVEALVEAGGTKIPKACVESCGPGATRREYRIQAARVGGDVRYMSRGESVRFASTIGVGAVRHTVEIDKVTVDGRVLSGGEGVGTDPYFLTEIGAQFNINRFLLEGAVALYVEGTDSIEGTIDGRDVRLYRKDGLVTLGLSLKVGWGEWAPR